MRDAGLPPGWQDTSLGELGSFFRGRGGTKADEEPNGLPCIRYGDLYTHHDCIVRSFASSISPASTSSYTRLQQGDVVFAGSGETFEEIGKAAAYCEDAPAYAGADTIIFRPGPDLLANFAGYAVNSESANAHKSRIGQGSSVIHIGSGHLSQMLFKLPPRQQQQRIAKILSTVDEAIEQTEALIAKTQQIKAGLMHDLFTRGVTADGQLRPPREEAPQLFTESPLGWIPEEWASFILDGSDIAIIDGDRGEHYPQSHELHSDGHCLFLSAANVTKRGLEFSSKQFVTRSKDAKLRTGKLVRGDVIITTRGTVGNIAYYDDAVPFSHVRINSGMVILRSSHPTLLAGFLYASLQQYIFGLEYKRVVSGSAQPQLPIRDLRRFNVLLPHADEQERILARVAAIDNQIASESETSSKLRELKHGLMHDLLTGRVPVAVESASGTKEVAANV